MAGTHPDEHALLAHAEGEGDDAVAGHVRTCPACAEQVRLLQAGRDALRSAPLLELGEERRKELIAALPERRERRAPFFRRLQPAAAAAAALVLVAGIVALATLAGGDGGDGGDGREEGGGAAPALESDRAAGGGEAATTTEKTSTPLQSTLGGPVRRVEGSVEDVIRLLQSQGIPAVQRNGSVLATGERDDVRAALAGLQRGPVAVYVR
jgi:hypothetical protein